MQSLADVRAQFPQYNDLSDTQLADALYTKFYSDMPRAEFDKKITPAPETYETAQSGVAKQFLKGIPLLGAGVDQAGAAVSALANPLTGAGEGGDSFSERYAKNLKNEKSESAQFERNHPGVTTAANLAGGITSVAPLGAVAPVARAMGLAGGPVIPNMIRGAASGAALNTADSALRGKDLGDAVVAGAVGGAAAPVIGRVLEPVFGSLPKQISSPTSEELKSAAKAGYDAARNSGIELKPQALTNFSTQVKNSLNSDGINDILAPKTFGVLDKIGTAPRGSTVTIDNFRTLQRSLGFAAKSPDATERMAAARAMEALNDHLENIPANLLLRGTAQDLAAANQTIRQANANYAASKRSDLVQGKVDRAELNAQTAHSGQNLDNSLRQQVKSILTNTKLRRQFSPEEQAAMMKVAAGTAPGNIIRGVGNILGGGGGLGAMHSAGLGFYTAGPAGLSAPLAGWAIKKAGNAITARNVAKLDELVRSRSPLAQQQLATSLAQAGGSKSNALQMIMSAAFLQDPSGRLNRSISSMFRALPPSGAVPAGAEGEQ